MSIEAGRKFLRGDYSQYTPTGKSYFVKHEEYSKTPHIGDIVYFYSGSLRRVAHVGAVISVSKKENLYSIDTVEGNTSSGEFDRNGGMVAIKHYTFRTSQVGGGHRIDGFGTPLYDESTCSVDDFVNTLKAEVGYIEKASNKNLDDKATNAGDANYTKYGAWYQVNCGGDHPAYWCQQFISYCAFKACQKHLENVIKGQWIKQKDGWYYKDENGNDVRGKWAKIAERWYVFDEAGRAIKGWFRSGNDWYYLNQDDYAMLARQWITVNGCGYYLERSGVMARNAYVKGDGDIYYFVSEEGKWMHEYDTKSPDLEKYEVAE